VVPSLPGSQPDTDAQTGLSGTPSNERAYSNPLSRYSAQLQILYLVGVIIMLPWIVFVYNDEPKHAIAYNVPLMRFGLTALLVTTVGATSLMLRNSNPMAALTGTISATLAAVTTWFAIVPATPHRLPVTLTFSLVVLLPTTLFSIAAARHALRIKTTNAAAKLGTYLGALAVMMAPLAVMIALTAHPEQTDIRERLLWTGLDLAELAAVCAVLITLRRRSIYLPIAAVAAATLFVCDAWYDVVGSAGTTDVSSVVMLAIEIPVVLLCLWVAYQGTRPGYTTPLVRTAGHPPASLS
jgi:hypothetical protein